MADTSTIMDSTSFIDFSDPSSYHDRVFIVGDQKFHVNSGVLSVWSEHFRRMFEGDFAEANKKEIEIKDVEPYLFKKYLLILYKNDCIFSESELCPMIGLSYRFLTPHALDYCKRFIDLYINKPWFHSIKVDLLRTALLYENIYLKKKLIAHFMRDKVMSTLNIRDVIDTADEYNLEQLKKWLVGFICRKLTVENCVKTLHSYAELNLPSFKKTLHSIITSEPLSYNLRDPNTKSFCEEYGDEIKALPKEILDFINSSV